MSWNDFFSSDTANILDLLAPVSSCIFGVMATANETKKDVVKKIMVNGKEEEIKSRELNKWGKISLVGLIVSMLLAVSFKTIKIISDNSAAKAKQAKDQQDAADAMRRYRESINLQVELKDSTRSILDSMKSSLAAQRSIRKASEQIQGRTAGILNLQNQSLAEQQAISLNTKRLLTPLFPMLINADFVVHFKDLSPEQRSAFWEIKKAIEEKKIEAENTRYLDKAQTIVSNASLSNIFSEDPGNRYNPVKNQLLYFEPAMVLNFKSSMVPKNKSDNRPAIFTVRFSRRLNNDIIPHASYGYFNFMDSVVHIHLSIEIANATNNDNFISLHDLKNASVHIAPYLNKRLHLNMQIQLLRINTGYKFFKSFLLHIVPAERTKDGYLHFISPREIGVE